MYTVHVRVHCVNMYICSSVRPCRGALLALFHCFVASEGLGRLSSSVILSRLVYAPIHNLDLNAHYVTVTKLPGSIVLLCNMPTHNI